MIFQYFSVIVLAAIIVMLYLQNRKIKRIDQATWNLPEVMREKINEAELRLYHQVEALIGLNALIQPTIPLPPMRGWAGSPDFLLEVARQATTLRPTTIVECSSGVSTLVAARCCQLNNQGHVYSLEHDPTFAHTTRDRLKEAGLEDWATVIDAPLRLYDIAGDTFRWYDDSGLPSNPIDLLIIDGPPSTTGKLARYPAGPRLIPRLSEDHGLILVDDANRPDEKEMLHKWSAEFPELASHPGFGEKGLVILHKFAHHSRQ